MKKDTIISLFKLLMIFCLYFGFMFLGYKMLLIPQILMSISIFTILKFIVKNKETEVEISYWLNAVIFAICLIIGNMVYLLSDNDKTFVLHLFR